MPGRDPRTAFMDHGINSVRLYLGSSWCSVIWHLLQMFLECSPSLESNSSLLILRSFSFLCMCRSLSENEFWGCWVVHLICFEGERHCSDLQTRGTDNQRELLYWHDRKDYSNWWLCQTVKLSCKKMKTQVPSPCHHCSSKAFNYF